MSRRLFTACMVLFSGTLLLVAFLFLGQCDADEGAWHRGSSIAGIVIDLAGKPVPEALLTASEQPAASGRFMWGRRQSASYTVHSDEHGRFRFDDLAPGALWDVRAKKAGFLSLTRKLIRTPEVGFIELQIEAASSLGGRVVDDEGRPIKNATLSVVSKENSPPAHHIGTDRLTDADGRFMLRGTATTGRVELWVDHEQFRRYRRQLHLASGEQHPDVEVVLERGQTLEIELRDADGQLVTDAAVSLSGLSIEDRHRSLSQAPYRFHGLEGSPYVVKVQHPRHPSIERRVEIGRESQRQIRLELASTFRLSGRVLDAEGQPAEMGTVDVIAVRGRRSVYSNSLGSSGGFSMHVPAGFYLLTVKQQGQGRLHQQPPLLVERGRENLELRLSPVQSFRVTVKNGAAASLNVWARGVYGSVDGELVTAGERAAEANFRLQPGRWQIVAEDRLDGRRVMEYVDVGLEQGAEKLAVSAPILDLDAAVPVSGRITLAGREVTGWGVSLAATDGSMPFALQTSSFQEGEFAWAGVPAGEYDLELHGPDFSHRRSLRLEAPTRLTLDLQSAEIRGRVSTADGLELPPGSRLLLRRLGESGKALSQEATRALTDPVFRFTVDTSASWLVTVVAPGYELMHREVTIGSTPPMPVELRLKPASPVRVRIRADSPVSRVRYCEVDGMGPERLAYRQIDGSFLFDTLSAASHPLLVSVPGRPAVLVNIEPPDVQAPKARPPVTIEVPRGGVLELLGELPATGIRLSLQNPVDGRPARFLYGAVQEHRMIWSSQVVTQVPAGNWLATLEGRGGWHWQGEVQVRAGELTRVNVGVGSSSTSRSPAMP